MPISISQIESALSVTIDGPIPWGNLATPPGPPPKDPGAYVVTLTGDRSEAQAAHAYSTGSLFDPRKIQNWIASVPDMRLDGNAPTPTAVAQYLSQFWHNDESIVYVGRASQRKLRSMGIYKRVNEFFGHTLGDPRPHAGGHWLLALNPNVNLFVWWVVTPYNISPSVMECSILSEFAKSCAGSVPLPFANRDGSCISLPRRKGSALAPQVRR